MVNDYHKDHHHVDHCPAARTVVSVMMMRCKPGRGFSLSPFPLSLSLAAARTVVSVMMLRCKPVRGFSLSLFPLSLSLAVARTVVSVMIVRSRLVRRLPPTPTTMILSTVILIKIMMTRMMLMMVVMMFRMVIMIMRIVMTIAFHVTVHDYVRNFSLEWRYWCGLTLFASYDSNSQGKGLCP